MKILCVYSVTSYSLKKELYCPADIPFGISFIATMLKKAGHDVRLAVVTPLADLNRMFKKILCDFDPGLICLTSVSSQMPMIRKVGKIIKENSPDIFVVLGGVHATLNPDETVALDFLDAICIGEGESAVCELASQLQEGKKPSGIKNLWIKDRVNGLVEKNSLHPFEEDLDELPFIDREMWEPYISQKEDMIYTVLAGRGCPNRCTFCSNHALSQITSGRYVRFRSPENIVEEIRQLLERDPMVSTVFLETETLGANLRYTYDLLGHLERFQAGLKRPLKFGTNLALNPRIRNNRKLLEAFRRANLNFFRIGLESGSEEIRNKVLRRPKYKNQDLIEFCRMAREYDIKYTVNILIGLPGESKKDFQETVRVTRLCRPTYGVSVCIFYPYPGTSLYNLCVEQNLLDARHGKSPSERTTSYLNLPEFTSWQIKMEYIFFYYKVFRGYEPMSKIMTKTLRYAVDAFPVFKQAISRGFHFAASMARK
ncbi:MAG: hypothetical protein DSZ23_01525 [Thermodesulfatator sp.]|nr:MAG: hypothetical protein DSZ23_01525 [Thermodesulfatator sp.]